MGGSQGASGINEIILATLPYLLDADSFREFRSEPGNPAPFFI